MNDVKNLLESIIGTYTPDVTSGVQGLAQIDWVWICSFVLVLALTVVFFKMVKEFFKGVFRL